jgi:hypothetical protein
MSASPASAKVSVIIHQIAVKTPVSLGAGTPGAELVHSSFS